MMMTAVRTPIHCANNGIPSLGNAETISIDESFAIGKTYKCGHAEGHEFVVVFDSPLDMPVFWECPDHEVIAFEN